MSDDIRVTKTLVIPGAEITTRFGPSGGPGGQHANKVATRVDLSWNVNGSAVLTERQRRLIKGRLRNRIDTRGDLRVNSDRHRSQLMNRRDAQQRLADLVQEALTPRRNRIATEPTAAARRRRVDDKRKRGEVKRLRRQPTDY